MLRELRIKNLAVVNDTVIPLEKGLNVLTGSTGAGKSIILSAVELLSGSRTRKSLLRRGTDRLTIEGLFEVQPEAAFRERLGMEADEKLLALKREMSGEGKSRIWINGMISTNSAARDLAQSLFELHGQHGQQEILDPSNHIHLLDGRGGYGALLSEVLAKVGIYRELKGRLNLLTEEAENHRKQEDYLRFQLKELEGLDLEPDLANTLETKIKRQENIHRYVSSLEGAYGALDGEDVSILEKLSQVEKALGSIVSVDGSWERAVEELGGIRISLQEIAREIERSLDEAGEGPIDLEQFQARLAAIQSTGRKYGLDCNGLIEKKRELERIIRSLTDGSDEIIETERKLRETWEELVPQLEKLSELRTAAAKRLDREITRELQKLGMKGADFHTSIDNPKNKPFGEAGETIDLFDDGWDRVEFRIRTNVGEEIHPLHEIVSGGELSRITLVLKALQVEGKGIPTLIFDEIDAGLGADLGEVVAERLDELAGKYQIICITHLPQIAARANHHIFVEKKVKGGRTEATAEVITGATRKTEIARMLGGRGKLREELAAELLEKV